jgi:hypothetical protein
MGKYAEGGVQPQLEALLHPTGMPFSDIHLVIRDGTASISNTEILERFQSKVLCMVGDAPWYVPNMVIRTDLQTPTVK